MKTPAVLKFKPKKRLAVHRLPYVGNDHRRPEHGGFSFWDVPLTGDYFGGNKAGRALGVIALQFFRETPEGDGSLINFHLQTVALTWLEMARTATPEEFQVLRGQASGFIGAICPWTILAARRFGGNLEKASPKSLLLEANQGLTAIYD